ncbi:MAG: ImmA/IrrE family metallo-endopeptidase [Acetobacteraceae bacterium]
MRHSIEWIEDAPNRAPEERATVADLRLFLHDQNVTAHMLAGKADDHVTIALYGLADGIVHDWWSILGARDREFSLRRYRTGYLIPDIRISCDGVVFEVSAIQSAYENPDLRFWGAKPELLTRAEGEAWLTSFVSRVLDRLVSKHVEGTSAALRWHRIQESRNAGEHRFCEAAGSLGLDPYQLPDEAARFIEDAEQVFGGTEPLVEFVAGAGLVDRPRLLDWVTHNRSDRGDGHRLSELRGLVCDVASIAPERDGEPAWSMGYRRARAARSVLNLDQRGQFDSFRTLARRLGAADDYDVAGAVDGISALRCERADGTHVYLRNHSQASHAEPTHLFALARAIGDAICFPRVENSAVNHVRHAYHQSAGRAFAAEFLAPIDEVMSMRNDAHDVYSIAARFGVSPSVIERQLENERRIADARRS